MRILIARAGERKIKNSCGAKNIFIVIAGLDPAIHPAARWTEHPDGASAPREEAAV
jgi:hypothetical protein